MEQKLDILAFAAHPDDAELSCSGTLMKQIELGNKVGIVDLTQGELGSRGSKEIRSSEAAEASKIMGIHARENLKLADGFFLNDEVSKLKIIEQIRRFRPKIVLANAISDRHPDHARASKLVSEACFLAGLMKIETTWDGIIQKAHRPEVVYHYIQDYHIEPDFVVDITGFMDKKMSSVLAYSSQFYDSNSKEPVTPITSKNFLDSITYRAQDLGRIVGVDFAEGFTVERYLAVNSLDNLK